MKLYLILNSNLFNYRYTFLESINHIVVLVLHSRKTVRVLHHSASTFMIKYGQAPALIVVV